MRKAPIALARRYFQILVAASADALAGEALTNLQFAALVQLSKFTGEPGIDQNSLAARMSVDRVSMGKLLEELEVIGLVDRQVDRADRRARLLRLTPRGERLRARVHPLHFSSQLKVLRCLSAKERALLIDLMARVIAANPTLARPGAGRRKRAKGAKPS